MVEKWENKIINTRGWGREEVDGVNGVKYFLKKIMNASHSFVILVTCHRNDYYSLSIHIAINCDM